MTIDQAIELASDDLKLVELGFKKNLNSSVLLVNKVSEYILRSGGKRLRPLLHILSARLCGYNEKLHIDLSQVIEFIHTATLLHDDVVDNATMRRGIDSSNIVWGNGASILVGDFLLSKSFEIAVRSNDLRILKLLSDTTSIMAEGEVLQLVGSSDIERTVEEYMRVIDNKTAILFAAASEMAALLSKVDAEKRDALKNYGRLLGTSYQLIDDALDYTSTDETLGKCTFNDLTESKVTLPLIKTYRDANPQEKGFIEKVIDEDDSSREDMERVFDIIKTHGGIEYTLQMASDKVTEAIKCLDIFEDNEYRQALTALALFVVEREN